MREIKFHGKRLNNGEWVEGFLFKLSRDIGYSWCIGTEPLSANDYSEIYQSCYEEVDPSTVGQYTGLKDKNGKEIYEGDICMGTRGSEAYLFIVKWDDDNARFLGYMDKGFICYVGREPNAEIIGNIHDNHSLLSGESHE